MLQSHVGAPSRHASILSTLFAWPARSSKPSRPTAWLDGLRGLAAFEVLIFHYVDLWTEGDPGYGADETHHQLYRLPLLRTFWNAGRCMVCTFFIISGYVLTQRSLKHLRKGAHEEVFASISSAIFRRGIRLFPPALFSCFIGFILVRLGYRGGKDNEYLPYFDSIFDQVVHFIVDTFRFINPFGWNLRSFGGDMMHRYEAVVWSIPMEFAGSMAIYIVLIGTARLRPRPRNIIIFCLGTFGLLQGCWSAFCFLMGILLADFQLAEDENTESAMVETQNPSQIRTILWSFALLQGFWMAGAPQRGPVERGDVALGFNLQWSLMPEKFGRMDINYTGWSIAGLLITASITRLDYARRFLETTFCQYLGKISFAIYLNHVWTRDVFGPGLKSSLERISGQSTAGEALALGLWFVIMILINFCVAGIFERSIDAPVVRFAKSLETKCLAIDSHSSSDRRSGIQRRDLDDQEMTLLPDNGIAKPEANPA